MKTKLKQCVKCEEETRHDESKNKELQVGELI